eukprot:4877765-Pleurochrysis_carterae.AAC.7
MPFAAQSDRFAEAAVACAAECYLRAACGRLVALKRHVVPLLRCGSACSRREQAQQGRRGGAAKRGGPRRLLRQHHQLVRTHAHSRRSASDQKRRTATLGIFHQGFMNVEY